MKKFILDEKMNSFVENFIRFTNYLITNEVIIGKTNRFISPKFLFEINEIMDYKQENVTVRSTELLYPLIHLFRNLCVYSKLFSEESIKGGKIALKPTDRMEIFNKLNNTEKYISLLEVLWVDCDFEKLQYQTYDNMNVYTTIQIIKDISSAKANETLHISGTMRLMHYATILLYLSYFGIMEIKEEQQADIKGRFFTPSEMKISSLGLEIIKILNKKRNLEQWNIPERKKYGEWRVSFEEEFYVPFKKLFKEGELNKILPRNNNEFKDGIYTFKVSLGKDAWANIQLDGNHTLDDLHECIQDAFDFDNDHLYSFFMDGRPWSDDKFAAPYDDEGPHADEVKIGELELHKNQKFLYLFDYGDEWRFNVEVIDIESSNLKLFKPEIVEFNGKAPKQYPDFEDEW